MGIYKIQVLKMVYSKGVYLAVIELTDHRDDKRYYASYFKNDPNTESQKVLIERLDSYYTYGRSYWGEKAYRYLTLNQALKRFNDLKNNLSHVKIMQTKKRTKNGTSS